MVGAFPRLRLAAACCGFVASVAATPAPPPAFAGLTLGSGIAAAAAVYPQATTSKVGALSIVRWKRPDGGKLTAYGDVDGTVWLIQFDGDRNEKGDLQLPCADRFYLQSSHVNLDQAATSSNCTRVGHNLSTYTLPDASVFYANFFGPGDGGLQTAGWATTGIPKGWAAAGAAAARVPGCTTGGREAAVIEQGKLDIPPADVQKEIAAGAAPDMDVEVMIGPDGHVKRASMYLSSGSDEFDNAAILAVQRSVYRPKTLGCKPVYGVYQFPFKVDR